MPVARSKAEGAQQIGELVQRFRDNQAYYQSAEFDETSTREQFINRFFEALGWDVLDEEGRGPAADVIFHQRLLTDPAVAGEEAWDEDLDQADLAAREPIARIPDYSFRLDEVTRFFVEAKRAGRELNARGPVFQVKSYAWSQRVRVGVLTNFRQLRVFDSSSRPEYDRPEAGELAVFRLDFTEYEQHWDQLWEVLSHEAVVGGSIEARTGRQRRGQQQVDDAFLEELSGWREELARDLYAQNPDLNQYELAEATQRILDRLVFLRVCEDRTLEQQVVLRGYARRTDAYRELVTEFRRLDQTYNGTLFAEHFCERLEVSDGVLQGLIAQLYFPASPYRFDVIGVDLLGAIYERFLGKEISTLDGRVRIEEKPEVRHAGGVYYTPTWVVRAIVERTVGPLLKDRGPQTAAALRIVDPACGSGSFLLGALEFLTEWYEAYYTANPGTDADRHYLGEDGQRHLTSDAKADIVRRNLFGVDIDPQAVEVAQMSLYLKILETETGASLHARPRLFPGPYLPSLRENIRCGNSLISPAQVPQQLLYDQQLRRRINPFDWHAEHGGFHQVFEDRGGFDAVIGNPPYTRIQVLQRFQPEECELYLEEYQAANASFDIASLFIEQGLRLLRPARGGDRGGRLGYIVSRTFAETDAAQPLRAMLSQGRNVAGIIDFGAGMVFQEASAYTTILELTKQGQRDYTLTRVPDPPNPAGLVEADHVGSPLRAVMRTNELNDGPWDLLLPSERGLMDRLAAERPSLRDISGNRIFQGVTTGADGVFRCADASAHPTDPGLRMVRPRLLDENEPAIPVETSLLRPVVQGSTDLKRFRLAASSEWLLLPYEREREEDRYQPIPFSRFRVEFPHATAWLQRNHEQLVGRAGQWDDENWNRYSVRKNLELFAQRKVLVPYMLSELCAAYDDDRHYFVNVSTGGYGVAISDEFAELDGEYLAALLNSELLSWVLKRSSRAFRGEYIGARNRNLAGLPVAVIDADQQARIVELYRACRQAAGQLDAAQSEHEQELADRGYGEAVRRFDSAVFDLYEVTPEELQVMRGG